MNPDAYYRDQNRSYAKNAVLSGAWVKVGRSHYRHASGAEVRRNCNTSMWEISNAPAIDWPVRMSCWVAMMEVERSCPSGLEGCEVPA